MSDLREVVAREVMYRRGDPGNVVAEAVLAAICDHCGITREMVEQLRDCAHRYAGQNDPSTGRGGLPILRAADVTAQILEGAGR